VGKSPFPEKGDEQTSEVYGERDDEKERHDGGRSKEHKKERKRVTQERPV
jgi:hypothetical protein